MMENCFVAVLSVITECREQQSLLEPVYPLQTSDRYLYWFLHEMAYQQTRTESNL